MQGHAAKVWEYAPGIYSPNRGSTQRLPGGNTLVGWDVPGGPLAQEVTADSPARVVYELRARPDAVGRLWSTYRAVAVSPHDAIAPDIGVSSLRDGLSVPQGFALIADYYCRDRGGSGLTSCGGSYRPGDVVDTSQLGTHSRELVAEDAAGHRTVLQRTYRVVPPAEKPEPQISALPP